MPASTTGGGAPVDAARLGRLLRLCHGTAGASTEQTKGRDGVIVIGVILLLIGLLTGIGLLSTVGAILLVVGVVLWILGAVGHQVGGRPHYY